jgi:hypothetical protein
MGSVYRAVRTGSVHKMHYFSCLMGQWRNEEPSTVPLYAALPIAVLGFMHLQLLRLQTGKSQ